MDKLRPLEGSIELKEPSLRIYSDLVKYHLFADDLTFADGGSLSGYQKKGTPPRVVIGFGTVDATAVTPVEKTFQYPNDFGDTYVRWDYVDDNNKRHVATDGRITITIGRYFSTFKGNFEFTDEAGVKYSGTFDLRR